MQLQTLRDAVRAQLDLDEEDYPNSRLDFNLREGFERTVQLADAWPSYAHAWSIETPTATPAVAVLPANVASLVSVSVNSIPLVHVAHSLAEEAFGPVVGGTVAYFSTWGTSIYLWPRPTVETVIEVRGYRLPDDWVAAGASAEVDADTRLHGCLVHYACSREYAFQEDDVLEARWLQTWLTGAQSARDVIMRPTFTRPIIVNRGLVRPTRQSIAWNL